MVGIRDKSAGFYVGVVACVLMIINIVLYTKVPSDIYSNSATFWMIGGIVVFAIASCFAITCDIASIALMISSFMGIAAFAQAPGTIDYLSTAFFDGFSMSAVFALPTPVWGSIFTFIIAFILGSVTMFLPLAKRKAKIASDKGEVR